MSAVSTAHSGSIRLNAVAIASAPKAATVTLIAKASCAFRDRIGADKRFRKAIMRPVPMFTDEAPYKRHSAWLLPAAGWRLETQNHPAYPVRQPRGNTTAAETAT